MRSPIRQLAPSEFPKRLTEIPDPPEMLYARGSLPPEDATYICIVGSRKMTPYGGEACRKLIEGLRGHNVVIVSGLALGTDGFAHKVTLEVGLPALAVPGSGLDDSVLYPRTNFPLAQEILARGGTLLSEFPPEHRARPENFPQRNRIMAGLSDAVLVIEAEIRSGTLITTRLATEYNRDVCAVPGSIFSPLSQGPHMLIRLGATPITSQEDLLDALDLKKEEQQAPSMEDLSLLEQQILSLLPLPRDELIQHLNLPAHEVNVMLSAMELKGIITERMGTIQLV